jgi:hypothetical protein
VKAGVEFAPPMNVRPVAWPANAQGPSAWGLLRSQIEEAVPGVVVSLVGIGLLVYGCAGRDSLRPPPPPERVLAAVPPPEPEPEPEVVARVERALLKSRPAESRRGPVRPAPPTASVAVARIEPPAPPQATVASQTAQAKSEPPPRALPPAAPAPTTDTPPPRAAPTPVASATAPVVAAPAPVVAAPAPVPKPAVAAPAAVPKPAVAAPAAVPKPAVAATAHAHAPKPVLVATAPASIETPPPPSPPAPTVAAPAPAPAKKRVDRKKRPTPMSAQDATLHLTAAWEEATGEPATLEVISVLWGQWALETGRGRWMVDYNFAGLKGRAPDGGVAHWWTWEESDERARRVRGRFRSYETAHEGALDYVQLLLRLYPRAVKAAREGNASAFVLDLDHGGFFTDCPKHYVPSVVSLALEFRRQHRAARF